MFAKIHKQRNELKELFYQKIKEKIEKEKKQIISKIDEDYPKFISWIAKGIASYKFDRNQDYVVSRGEDGETDLTIKLFLILPKDCEIFPDFVLEPEKDKFIQIDLIVINMKGIFLVEVKNWQGSFIASDRGWKMRQGNKWVEVSNPSKQHKRHYELFKKWLQDNMPEEYSSIKDYIYPVIVIKEVKWIKSQQSTIPVVEGASGFLMFMAEKPKGALNKEIIEKIRTKLLEAKPYEEKIRYVEGINKNGKRFVKIYGTKDDAENIYKRYSNIYKVDELKADKFEKDTFYFYFEENQAKYEN